MKTALVVDDNPNVRHALRAFLEGRLHLTVSGEAADGSDAIRKAGALRPDLIIMDLSMPILSGAGAASVIRKLVPATRIILFTLYSDAVGRNFASDLGVDLVIDKSRGASGLADALAAILSSRRPRKATSGLLPPPKLAFGTS